MMDRVRHFWDMFPMSERLREKEKAERYSQSVELHKGRGMVTCTEGGIKEGVMDRDQRLGGQPFSPPLFTTSPLTILSSGR